MPDPHAAKVSDYKLRLLRAFNDGLKSAAARKRQKDALVASAKRKRFRTTSGTTSGASGGSGRSTERPTQPDSD